GDDAAPDMDSDVGEEELAALVERDVGLDGAVEIFRNRSREPVLDAMPQRGPDIEVPAGNGDVHSLCRSARSLWTRREPQTHGRAARTGADHMGGGKPESRRRTTQQKALILGICGRPTAGPAGARQRCPSAFMRRRSTEDGMRIASRYLATVRRARS